ncbi:hypothetical protein BN10_640005 [Phycicoccus elongatus Lp2]|uniref:Uncharacterized protein n=1 Tax=Phycicoccus elongatus Lp2 TaxID=1193181 RepID=N0E4D8_9MICO|nr:hypothetical protein BN10_640005 [Phycicoccus elongatus Lp2]
MQRTATCVLLGDTCVPGSMGYRQALGSGSTATTFVARCHSSATAPDSHRLPRTCVSRTLADIGRARQGPSHALRSAGIGRGVTA